MLTPGLPEQPHPYMKTHANSYMTWQITNAWQFINPFLLIFTPVILVQNTIDYIGLAMDEKLIFSSLR